MGEQSLRHPYIDGSLAFSFLFMQCAESVHVQEVESEKVNI